MVSLDQSAALRISEVVTPDQAADEQAAPQTECALKVSVLTPASWRLVRNHLAWYCWRLVHASQSMTGKG